MQTQRLPPLLLGHSFLYNPSSTSTVPQHWDRSALLLLTITSSGAEAGCSAKWQRLSSQAWREEGKPDCLLLLFHSLDLNQHWSFLGNLRQLQPKRDCWQWMIFKPGPKSIQAHDATLEPAAQLSTRAFGMGALCSRNASSLSCTGKDRLHD